MIVSALGLKGCESGGMADALDSGSSGLCACGGSSPPFRTIVQSTRAPNREPFFFARLNERTPQCSRRTGCPPTAALAP